MHLVTCLFYTMMEDPIVRTQMHSL